jgi:4a-hydroxytetrahydrobiopterin dehydratase
MAKLHAQQCIPCRDDVPALTQNEIESFLEQVPEWNLEMEGTIPRITRSFSFDDFSRALSFTGKVGEIAEQQGHHPRITTEWGKVEVSWWTHKIKGLHANDFIMASKTDTLYDEFPGAAS